MTLRIVFFGTPHFAATILHYLLEEGASIVAVVTKPDRPRGRSKKPLPPPVKIVAETYHLPLFQPQKASDPNFINSILQPLQPDLFVVAAYSEIFKENLLSTPRLGCINVHASILPRYRGAAPIQRCIMAGEKESGVTIMAMEKELDAGKIFTIEKTAISENMTAGELSEKLSKIGGKALFDVMQKVEDGTIKPTTQDPSETTFAPKLTPADGKIDWHQPAEVVHNQIRGLAPKPSAWCSVIYHSKTLRLLIEKSLPELFLQGEPASLLPTSGLVVGCGKGSLRILQLKLEGKKSMSADEFLRGVKKEDLMLI